MNSPLRKWRRNETKNNPKPQPLIQCFTYNEISKATNDFHQGEHIREREKNIKLWIKCINPRQKRLMKLLVLVE